MLNELRFTQLCEPSQLRSLRVGARGRWCLSRPQVLELSPAKRGATTQHGTSPAHPASHLRRLLVQGTVKKMYLGWARKMMTNATRSMKAVSASPTPSRMRSVYITLLAVPMVRCSIEVGGLGVWG